MSAADWSLPHVTGQLLITDGLQALSVTPSLKKVPAGLSDEAYADQLARAGHTVQPDYLYAPLNVSIDPGVPGTAGLGSRRLHQVYLSRTNTLATWTALLAEGRQPVSASSADLDTSIDLTHPEFAGRLLPEYDTCSALNSNMGCVVTTATRRKSPTRSRARHGHHGPDRRGPQQRQRHRRDDLVRAPGSRRCRLRSSAATGMSTPQRVSASREASTWPCGAALLRAVAAGVNNVFAAARAFRSATWVRSARSKRSTSARRSSISIFPRPLFSSATTRSGWSVLQSMSKLATSQYQVPISRVMASSST